MRPYYYGLIYNSALDEELGRIKIQKILGKEGCVMIESIRIADTATFGNLLKF